MHAIGQVLEQGVCEKVGPFWRNTVRVSPTSEVSKIMCGLSVVRCDRGTTRLDLQFLRKGRYHD